MVSLGRRATHVASAQPLASTQETYAFTVSQRVFHEFGLRKAIRTDNGVPLASAQALFGLNKLAVWWLRLGIAIERIKAGRPQQNGRHERMHPTLKQEATKPVAQNLLQHRKRFDDFIDCYNHERPHQALDMRYPAEPYAESRRPYRRSIGALTGVFISDNSFLRQMRQCQRSHLHSHADRKAVGDSRVNRGAIVLADRVLSRSSFCSRSHPRVH